jgi:hypothetical protein
MKCELLLQTSALSCWSHTHSQGDSWTSAKLFLKFRMLECKDREQNGE